MTPSLARMVRRLSSCMEVGCPQFGSEQTPRERAVLKGFKQRLVLKQRISANDLGPKKHPNRLFFWPREPLSLNLSGPGEAGMVGGRDHPDE